MADQPDGIVLRRHRDLEGRTWHPWLRRALLGLVALVLDQDWLDGLTVNTIEPSPVNEASRDGSLALELGHLPAGARHVLYVEYQVNPTTVGRRTLKLELDDGETPVATLSRSLRIFP